MRVGCGDDVCEQERNREDPLRLAASHERIQAGCEEERGEDQHVSSHQRLLSCSLRRVAELGGDSLRGHLALRRGQAILNPRGRPDIAPSQLRQRETLKQPAAVLMIALQHIAGLLLAIDSLDQHTIRAPGSEWKDSGFPRCANRLGKQLPEVGQIVILAPFDALQLELQLAGGRRGDFEEAG